MTAALATLAAILTRSARGRARLWLRHLRRPRYLAGFAVGTAYFAWYLGSAITNPSWASRSGELATSGAVQLLVALVLSFWLSLTWVILPGRSTLRLGLAEAHLLLPAPLSRRAVLGYAVLKSQAALLFSALMLALFFGGPTWTARLRFLPAAWIVVAILDLHAKKQGLWRCRLEELPIASARARRLLLTISLALYGVLVLAALASMWEPLRKVATEHGPGQELALRFTELGHAGALGWLLWPMRTLLDPLGNRSADLGAWAGAAILLALHLEWVLRSPARFEEAVLAGAESDVRRAQPLARLERVTARARRWQPFVLAPGGAPEVAVLWKNFLLIGRYPIQRALAFGALAMAVLTAGLCLLPTVYYTFTATLLAGVGVALAILGSLLAGAVLRNDLRTDLLHLESIRTWPLSPTGFVLCEALGPALVGSLRALAGLGLLAAALSSRALRDTLGIPVEEMAYLLGPRTAWAAAGLLPMCPALAFFSSTVHNLATLLFPGWMRLGLQRARGPAATGQVLLQSATMLLALALGLVPGAVLVLVAAMAQRLAGLPFALFELPLAAALLAAPLVIQGGALVILGARRWQRLDPGEELLPRR